MDWVDFPSSSLPTTLEGFVAEQLIDLIPCAEMVRFTKTGSEAVEGAIRIARAATGRDRIVSCGYHSWHSWYAATRPEHPGVPASMCDLVDTFDYNDVFGMCYALDGTPPAAVIIEPTLIEPPAPGFLEAVAAETRKAGAVLIFDETVTGFRWHKSGYQAVCGIVPDLAIFGKGMGNGYSVAAIVGKRALMEDWGRLVSGTFNGETIGLAAASAVIEVYQREDIPGRMRYWGERLFRDFGAYLVGQPYHPKWNFEPDVMALFLQETAKRGVLFHPGGFNVCAALTEVDYRTTADAVERALYAIERGDELEGKPINPHPFRVTR